MSKSRQKSYNSEDRRYSDGHYTKKDYEQERQLKENKNLRNRLNPRRIENLLDGDDDDLYFEDR
jgi:hypothetical protein